MSDFTIRTSTTPPATIKVQLDPSQSVAEAVAAADAAAASEAAAAASETAAAGSASSASTSASAAASSASAAAASAAAASTDADEAAASAAAAAATLDSSLKKADNLSDLASAATARTNLGATTVGDAVFIAASQAAAQTAIGSPPSTRNIATGSGLSGGGDLSDDRTLAVSFAANQSEVKTALNASGSAPIYACRAWVNFNGTGTVAIRASGNVTSITDNGTGDYTVNFATAMPDANYAVSSMGRSAGAIITFLDDATAPLAGSFRMTARNSAGTNTDIAYVYAAVFR